MLGRASIAGVFFCGASWYFSFRALYALRSLDAHENKALVHIRKCENGKELISHGERA